MLYAMAQSPSHAVRGPGGAPQRHGGAGVQDVAVKFAVRRAMMPEEERGCSFPARLAAICRNRLQRRNPRHIALTCVYPLPPVATRCTPARAAVPSGYANPAREATCALLSRTASSPAPRPRLEPSFSTAE